jgi:hypothetical protein
MVKYYQHKEIPIVICELINNKLRFSKWKWRNPDPKVVPNICNEIYTYKDVTTEVFKSFKEISQTDFNTIWGEKLHKA